MIEGGRKLLNPLVAAQNFEYKMSNILGGARTIFRNVFVKHLEELVIRGMGDWYTGMWSRGVRFHYVVRWFKSSVVDFMH